MDLELRKHCGFDGFCNFLKRSRNTDITSYDILRIKYIEFLKGAKLTSDESKNFAKSLIAMTQRGYLPLVSEQGVICNDTQISTCMSRDYVCFLLPLDNQPTFVKEAKGDDRFTEYLIDVETEVKQRQAEIKKDEIENSKKHGPIEPNEVSFDFASRRAKPVCIDKPAKYFNYMMLRYPVDYLSGLNSDLVSEITSKYIAVHICDNEWGSQDRIFQFLNSIFDRFTADPLANLTKN